MEGLSLLATRDALVSDGLPEWEANCIVYYGAHYASGFLASISQRVDEADLSGMETDEVRDWLARKLRDLSGELVIEAAKLGRPPGDRPRLPVEVK